MKTNRTTLVVLSTCVLFYTIMCIWLSVMWHIAGVPYGSPKTLLGIFPLELFNLTLLTYMTMRFFPFETIGLGRVKGGRRWVDQILVILPVILAGWLLVRWLLALSPQGWGQINKIGLLFGILGLGMVGVAEEWMFRGIALHHFTNLKGWQAILSRWSTWLMVRGLTRHDWCPLASQATGVLISAVLFSAYHVINLLGGYPPEAVGYQVIGTLAFGIVFGVLALWLPSLRPLMAFHFCWDFFVIAGSYISLFH